jgi:hypothetical protein
VGALTVIALGLSDGMTSEETELRKIVQKLGLRRESVVAQFPGGSALQHKFDISPEEFLQQAEDDFEPAATPHG